MALRCLQPRLSWVAPSPASFALFGSASSRAAAGSFPCLSCRPCLPCCPPVSGEARLHATPPLAGRAVLETRFCTGVLTRRATSCAFQEPVCRGWGSLPVQSGTDIGTVGLLTGRRSKPALGCLCWRGHPDRVFFLSWVQAEADGESGHERAAGRCIHRRSHQSPEGLERR